MNPAEKLKKIIEERREWETFGWRPILLSWGALLSIKSAVEIWTDFQFSAGIAAYSIGIVLQLLIGLVLLKGTLPAKNLPLHFYWIFAAVVSFAIGDVAPHYGVFSGVAARVVETFFLATILFQTGLVKSRNSLKFGAFAMIILSLAQGTWKEASYLQPIAFALGFVVPCLFVMKETQRQAPNV